MSTADLKSRLIEKIHLIDDQLILLKVLRLIGIYLDNSETPFILTEDQNNAIDEARNQIKSGEFLSHEESIEDIEKWFEE